MAKRSSSLETRETTMIVLSDAARAVLSLNPPANVVYKYGTAGFRRHADHHALDCALLRAAMAACIRARSQPSGVVGIMITASHNLKMDNGAKLADTDGGMLAAEYEQPLEALANASSVEEAAACLQAIAGMRPFDANAPAVVVVARDTRETSEGLRDMAIKGVEAMGGSVIDLGIQTTPVLHWVVREMNAGRTGTVDAYNASLAAAFRALRPAGAAATPVAVDCACGVGATGLAALQKVLGDAADLRAFNVVGEGELNDACGAEHVQKQLALPRNADKMQRVAFCASLDGDADRIVFFGTPVDGTLRLCDGDKIACLLAQFVVEQVAALQLDARVGVVQTAYANGGSSAFIRNALPGVEMSVVATGVKHLHHKALEYDVGVYFEANGHGTVLFKDTFVSAVRAAPAGPARDALLAAAQLANQAVGDALGDLLLVVALLERRGGALFDGWLGLYTELCSRQGKVRVPDRTAIKTTADETQTTAPKGLQAAIDAVVAASGPTARAFVRPSGTEDVVRTYAEASTREAADALEQKVAACVERFCKGGNVREN